jgi:hypothetical protein
MDSSTFKEIVSAAKRAGVHNYATLEEFVAYELDDSLAEQMTGSDYYKVLEKLED